MVAAPPTPPAPPNPWRELEKTARQNEIELWVDSVTEARFFMSLNAGALLLIAAFLREQPRVPWANVLVGFALSLFLVSFLASFFDSWLSRGAKDLYRTYSLHLDAARDLKDDAMSTEAAKISLGSLKAFNRWRPRAWWMGRTSIFSFFAGVLTMAAVGFLIICSWSEGGFMSIEVWSVLVQWIVFFALVVLIWFDTRGDDFGILTESAAEYFMRAPMTLGGLSTGGLALLAVVFEKLLDVPGTQFLLALCIRLLVMALLTSMMAVIAIRIWQVPARGPWFERMVPRVVGVSTLFSACCFLLAAIIFATVAEMQLMSMP